jgi:hypothetical protein
MFDYIHGCGRCQEWILRKKRPLLGFSGFRREKAEAPKMRKRKSALY